MIGKDVLLDVGTELDFHNPDGRRSAGLGAENRDDLPSFVRQAFSYSRIEAENIVIISQQRARVHLKIRRVSGGGKAKTRKYHYDQTMRTERVARGGQSINHSDFMFPANVSRYAPGSVAALQHLQTHFCDTTKR